MKLFQRSDRVRLTTSTPPNHDHLPPSCSMRPLHPAFIAGSDAFQLRVFNHNAHETIMAFEAHPDRLRCLAVHPRHNAVFTGYDDMTVRAWDWDKQ